MNIFDTISKWKLVLGGLVLVFTLSEFVFGAGSGIVQWHKERITQEEIKQAEAIASAIASSRAIQDLQDQVQNMLLRQAELLRRLDDLKIEEPIAEYDPIRSFIDMPTGDICIIGEPCTYQFRARRTERGLRCSAPDPLRSQGVVVNHGGLHHNVDLMANFSRADQDYTIFAGNFIPPLVALPGRSEFYISLRYTGCDTGDDLNTAETKWEDTISLKFRLEGKN